MANRSDTKYKKRKAAYLAAHEEWGGWWICQSCGKWTQEPELDHIDRTGMGGSPSLLLDESNWALLCNNCHARKDSGFKYKTR